MRFTQYLTMKTNVNNRIGPVNYLRFFSIVANARDRDDFIDRSKLLSNFLIEELARQLKTQNVIFPFQVVPVINGMNTDVKRLVRSINVFKHVDNQPEISEELFLNLISLNNPKLFEDYKYASETYLN